MGRFTLPSPRLRVRVSAQIRTSNTSDTLCTPHYDRLSSVQLLVLLPLPWGRRAVAPRCNCLAERPDSHRHRCHRRPRPQPGKAEPHLVDPAAEDAQGPRGGQCLQLQRPDYSKALQSTPKAPAERAAAKPRLGLLKPAPGCRVTRLPDCRVAGYRLPTIQRERGASS
ncbi:hypothetical protein NDU88_008840 [Pleurodeles waltl]|uniref:Uncharacterized protein n=1 Tax=Pleurodeles waltl TaxID=8319 RepID=A0AAV7RXC1_PLEWA|nr:hypothetical protein NDU88_008840 [Pleurodeles waltl]